MQRFKVHYMDMDGTHSLVVRADDTDNALSTFEKVMGIPSDNVFSVEGL